MLELNKIYCGDTMDLLKRLDDKSIHCCITSPPYWGLRDYGVDGQIGQEKTLEEYLQKMVDIFQEVKRCLKNDGTLWLNMGDCYTNNNTPAGCDPTVKKRNIGTSKYSPTIVTGIKPKNLLGVPWRVAFALQDDGWYLRQDIIWAKPNPMPESVTDRCTKSHEYIFLLSKSAKYYFDQDAIKEPAGIKGNANSFRGGAYCNGNKDNALLGKRTVSGNTKIKIPSGWETGKGLHGNYHKDGRGISKYSFKRKTATPGKPGVPDQHRQDREDIEYCGTRNKRSVWTVATYPYKKAHFATFPPKLIEPCVLAGCPKGGIVLDIFVGSGTTPAVAIENNRQFLGFDLNPDYVDIANKRLSNINLNLF